MSVSSTTLSFLSAPASPDLPSFHEKPHDTPSQFSSSFEPATGPTSILSLMRDPLQPYMNELIRAGDSTSSLFSNYYKLGMAHLESRSWKDAHRFFSLGLSLINFLEESEKSALETQAKEMAFYLKQCKRLLQADEVRRIFAERHVQGNKHFESGQWKEACRIYGIAMGLKPRHLPYVDKNQLLEVQKKFNASFYNLAAEQQPELLQSEASTPFQGVDFLSPLNRALFSIT